MSIFTAVCREMTLAWRNKCQGNRRCEGSRPRIFPVNHSKPIFSFLSWVPSVNEVQARKVVLDLSPRSDDKEDVIQWKRGKVALL